MADIGVHASGVSCEPLTFRTLDTPTAAPARDLEMQLALLLFAARGLANHRIKVSRSRPTQEPMVYCDECQMAALHGHLTHSASCRAGSVLEILEAICGGAIVTPVPSDHNPLPNRRKEDAPAAESARAEDGKPSCAEFGEPWKAFWTVDEVSLFNRELYQLASMSGAVAEAYDHAERTVACVNFCAGISTERLQAELPLASADRRRFCEINFLRRALPWLGTLPTEADDSAVML